MVRCNPPHLLLLGLLLLIVNYVNVANGEALFYCASDDVLQHSSSEVIPVPLNSVGAGEWLSLVISVNQVAGNASMVLRSLNANCNVEVKFRDYAASQNTYLRVYPKGRSAAYDLPRNLGYCYPYGPLGSVTLGSSALSLGQELGVVLYSQTIGGGIVAAFELWYRQRCPGDALEAADGFQFPSPPVTGEPMSKTFDAVLSIPANPGSTKGLRVSIPPPLPTCSVETIINSANVNWINIRADPNYYDWKSAYVAIPFLGAAGTATEVSAGAAGVIQLNLTYRAVCGPGASISSRFRPPFQPPILLNSTKSWTTVELDMTNVSARSVVMWRFRRGNPATTQTIVEKDLWNSTTSALVFRDGFDTSVWFTPENFDSTSEMVVSLYVSSFTPSVRVAFRARLISTLPMLDQPPIPVTSESWQNLTIALVETTKWRLRSVRPDCRVEAGFAIIPQAYRVLTWIRVRDSFNPNISMLDGWTYGASSNEGVSFGQEIGLGLDLRQGIITSVQEGPILWPYRLHCINHVLNPTLNRSWASVEFKALTSELFFISVTPQFSREACVADMFVISLSPDGFAATQVVCGDRWASTIRNSTVQTMPLGVCGSVHVTPLSANPMIFVYRTRCAGDRADNPTADRDIGQVVHVNSDMWRRVKWNNSYSDPEWDWYSPIKTFRAKSPNCVIELFARHFDIAGGLIFENFLQADRVLMVPDRSTPSLQFETITYTSCTNKLYVRASVGPWQQIKVRQICPTSGSPYHRLDLCGQLERTVQATFDWQTINFAAWNPNQLRESMLQIALPAKADDQLVIELHFSSLVEQVLLGLIWAGRDGAWQVINAARVRTNGFPAFLGKSRLFRTNVTITADIIAEKGDHIFTAKFRLRNLTESRSPSPGLEVLTATNKTQFLRFRIPPQFSEARRQRIVAEGDFFLEDEYAPEYATGGRYYRWMYRHAWAIKPKTAGCHVRTRVIKLDIGLGDTVIERSFKKLQHRLAIGPTTSDREVSAFDGHKCDQRHTEKWPFFQRSWTVAIANSTQNFVCAKVGPDYISNSSNGLVIRFESVSREMYEYEAEGVEEYERRVRSEAEETWGSGWELEYSQVCDDERAKQIVNRPLIQVAATSTWQTLPIFDGKSSTWEFFKDMRYLIIPSKQKCQVRVLWKTSMFHYQRILQLFDARGHGVLPGTWEYDPSSDEKYELNIRARNFTVLVHSKIPSKRQGRFIFRQDCNVETSSPTSSLVPQTKSPTQSPTLFPTLPAPTYSPTQLTTLAKDGFSCYKSDQCQSGICSMTLMSCLSQACMTQCKAYSNPAACNAFAQARCVCRWDPAGKQCLILP